ncbi:hypothetical protein EFR01_11030 [Sinorhizobium fredii]|nr:hypothetical protein EFR01_11030 [Sinorhizobium fredii]GLS11391.1 hypothetical protein GCM10007864_50220 [Sinorhizobium fredii]
MHPLRVVDTEEPEDLKEDRHKDGAAADAEEAGKYAGHDTGRGQRQGKHHQFRERRHGKPDLAEGRQQILPMGMSPITVMKR